MNKWFLCLSVAFFVFSANAQTSLTTQRLPIYKKIWQKLVSAHVKVSSFDATKPLNTAEVVRNTEISPPLGSNCNYKVAVNQQAFDEWKKVSGNDAQLASVFVDKKLVFITAQVPENDSDQCNIYKYKLYTEDGVISSIEYVINNSAPIN